MIFNCMEWERDNDTEKIHPTQKPIGLLSRIIEIFTDEGDVIIDPCAGSGSSLIAALRLNRKAFGFEIKKDFYRESIRLLNNEIDIKKYGYSKTVLNNDPESLFYIFELTDDYIELGKMETIRTIEKYKIWREKGSDESICYDENTEIIDVPGWVK